MHWNKTHEPLLKTVKRGFSMLAMDTEEPFAHQGRFVTCCNAKGYLASLDKTKNDSGVRTKNNICGPGMRRGCFSKHQQFSTAQQLKMNE